MPVIPAGVVICGNQTAPNSIMTTVEHELRLVYDHADEAVPAPSTGLRDAVAGKMVPVVHRSHDYVLARGLDGVEYCVLGKHDNSDMHPTAVAGTYTHAHPKRGSKTRWKAI